MASCQIYPFTTTNARLFSQDLIQYVLEDFGHVWKPQRSPTEATLRKVALFSFTEEIGETVAYLSRKHDRFVVMTCYKSWKYIKSHRVYVMEFLLFNDISFLCSRCELEDDDFGLFIFMSIVVEYARFAIVDQLEHLVEDVVKALSHCLENLIPGGYVTTIQRMQYRASTFNLSELFINANDGSFTMSVSPDSVTTPRSDSQTRINHYVDFLLGSIKYKTPMWKKIEVKCRRRELHRSLFKHALKAERSSETNEDNASAMDSQNVPSKSNIYAQVDSKEDLCSNKSSSMKEQVKFKVIETNVETRSKNDESPNNSEMEVKKTNFSNTKIQNESSQVSHKEVSSTYLRSPAKNVDISKTFEMININENNQSSSKVLKDSKSERKESSSLKELESKSDANLKALSMDEEISNSSYDKGETKTGNYSNFTNDNIQPDTEVSQRFGSADLRCLTENVKISESTKLS